MFLELFDTNKPIMAMIHLKGDTPEEILQRAIREADIYRQCGVDAIIIEDYFGNVTDVERALKFFSQERPQYVLGVNVLHDLSKSFQLAQRYGAKFVQIDSICGHLVPVDEEAYFEKVDLLRDEYKISLIGGVRFKYQKHLSNRSLEEDLEIGMQHCDAIAVTGSATGVETDIKKIIRFREIIGDFPLIVAAGMTKETVREKLSVGDAAIVGSTFKDSRKDSGEVYADHVFEFMEEVCTLLR